MPNPALVADVVVVGFGCAGACAALAAAEAGAEVLILDRFEGGGTTALSGGVVYAGGGTAVQRAAGVSDSVEAMYAYLRHEVGDAVSERTLRAFCQGSAELLDWLIGHGVPFDASLCPYKTSYPTDQYYLYHSGSEQSLPEVAPPAPRGHRAFGPGTSGRVLFARLAGAVRGRGVRVLPQSRAVRVIQDGAGRAVGVEAVTLEGAPRWVRTAHRRLHRLTVRPSLYLPGPGRRVHRLLSALERRYGRSVEVLARRGVVLAAGGYVADRELMREHAPGCRGTLPLGTVADDGSGLRLGLGAGAVGRRLDSVSLWRFITPPQSAVHGLLVDTTGRRLCDESRYGAALGAAILDRADGRAWLLLDAALLGRIRRELWGQGLWFQRFQGAALYTLARRSAPTLAALAEKAGIDPDGLAATVAGYNDAARTGRPDALGKAASWCRPLDRPPYSLVDLSLRPRWGGLANPAPVLPLGGLAVDEDSGEVLDGAGRAVPGLYAAGRTAAGICSTTYLSGLSLADCAFSGRRAGRHAATRAERSPSTATSS